MPTLLTKNWTITEKDHKEGYELRSRMCELFIEWELASNATGAYRLMHDLIYADGEDDSRFTEDHVRKLRAVINHGYPMYRILLIQKA